VATLADRLRRLKDERRVFDKEIAAGCGVSTQMVNRWLKGAMPRAKHLTSLAEYFHTTVEYLVHGNRPAARIATARELIKIGRKLTDSQLHALLVVAREYLKQS